MDRFKNESEVVYDANIIIFYCFLYKTHRIVEKTNKARKLTQYLVNNGVGIMVPEFIIHEINNKGFPKIVNNYLNDKKNVIVDVSKNPPHGLTLRLVQKLQNNFKNSRKKITSILKNMNLKKNYLIPSNHFLSTLMMKIN